MSLGTLQSLLAIIFVMTGAMKLLTPGRHYGSPIATAVGPGALRRIVEVAGALGMILPGLLRIGRA
jgi:hypothetical protein